MSKRKLPSDDHSPPSFSPHSSDTMPCSSGMDLLTQEHHPSLGRSMFLRRSRHHYAHQYSRRTSGNLANTSTSRGKGVPLHDDKLSYKLATQSSSESRRHSAKEKPFLWPARIRSRFLATDAVSPDPGKMVCGICDKLFRRKPFFLGSTLSSTEVSVVAVLVCGHLYHADCLEQKTSFEDRHDPHLPIVRRIIAQG
ncbi:uncharacterized protein LOC103949173 isoform X2 [Pyrus x bretschneideri]|uniref:uncharacterized protein LOC103949173 isoform X2 n=1 Tax=Pyrus x bretschneideri TaxID=225117 RepID=UPI00203073BF|nr:uncharacterized protein LOC103949173 isoform X2 [Pyrus x bretschneideri]